MPSSVRADWAAVRTSGTELGKQSDMQHEMHYNLLSVRSENAGPLYAEHRSTPGIDYALYASCIVKNPVLGSA